MSFQSPINYNTCVDKENKEKGFGMLVYNNPNGISFNCNKKLVNTSNVCGEYTFNEKNAIKNFATLPNPRLSNAYNTSTNPLNNVKKSNKFFDFFKSTTNLIHCDSNLSIENSKENIFKYEDGMTFCKAYIAINKLLFFN